MNPSVAPREGRDDRATAGTLWVFGIGGVITGLVQLLAMVRIIAVLVASLSALALRRTLANAPVGPPTG